MEGVNKSLDVNEKFIEIEGIFKVYKEDPERSDNNLNNRVCKIVDEINVSGGTL